MTNKESLVVSYLINNGKTFFIKNVDTYRDGGTTVFETTKPDVIFYMCPKTNNFHFNYPLENNNKITDKETIAYFLDRLNRFKQNLESKLYKAREVEKILIHNNL